MSPALQRPHLQPLEGQSSPFLMAKVQREELLRHFGFHESPFGVTPDPEFLFWSGMHDAALQGLISSIESNLGFSVLLGEPGTGKTTLLFQLLTLYRERARTGFVFQTQCRPHDLLRHIAAELELEGVKHDEVSLHLKLKSMLVEEARAGRKVIIVIDEAQNLQPASLEAVRLLSDFETAPCKLLHVVLAGSLGLRDTLLLPELSQLAQRILTICQLQPLDHEGVKNYVGFRLEVAGAKLANEVFPLDSLRAIAAQSRGIPRIVNAICYRSLVLAYFRGERSVQAELVKQAARDMDLSETSPREWVLPETLDKAHHLLTRSRGPAASEHPVSIDSGKLLTGMPVKEAGAANQGSRSHSPHVRTRNSALERRAGIPRASGTHNWTLFVLGFILFGFCSWLAWNQARVNSPASVDSAIGSGSGQSASAAARSSQPAAPATKALVEQNPSVPSTKDGLEQSPGEQAPIGSTMKSNAIEKLPPHVAGRHEVAVVDTTSDAQSSSRLPHPTTVEEPAVPDDVEKFSTAGNLKMPVAGITTALVVPERSETVSKPQGVESLPPRATTVVQPKYPAQARLHHVEGEVQLEVTIDRNGHVQEVHPLSGHPILIQAAEEAVRQWRYAPSTRDQIPVPAVTRVRLHFTLNQEQAR